MILQLYLYPNRYGVVVLAGLMFATIICYIPYSGKVWQIDSFHAFGERKFGELIDQPIGYQL